MWIIMAKGQTYYVEHVSADLPWTTKETPDKNVGGFLFTYLILKTALGSGNLLLANDFAVNLPPTNPAGGFMSKAVRA